MNNCPRQNPAYRPTLLFLARPEGAGDSQGPGLYRALRALEIPANYKYNHLYLMGFIFPKAIFSDVFETLSAGLWSP